jgi:glycerophosphoryl diester phosphodiesterase
MPVHERPAPATLILGHRGAPLVAPENTLSSLRLALEQGLDGFEYDVQPSAGGEAVLLHDDTLERTTDGHGPVDRHTLAELIGLDAGSWFHKAYAGERLPLFEEALEVGGERGGERPLHMIELKQPGLVREVARALGEQASVRAILASFHRAVVLEARDHGLATMLLAERADDEDREFVARERVDAHGVGPGGWRTEAGQREWACQRWSWSVDEPADLLEALRYPFNGINTNEGPRALALRELVRLAPDDRGAYPLGVGELLVDPQHYTLGRGEWCGHWNVPLAVRNPFAWDVEIAFELLVRRGAFEVGALPAPLRLAAGEQRAFAFELTGGSFSPGGDPCLAARYTWKNAAGAAAGTLVLDAPLQRVRQALLRMEPLRLPLLREEPHQPDASVLVRRKGRSLHVSIENPGRLHATRVWAHLAGDVHVGTKGLRLELPYDFDTRRDGVRFSCGLDGLPEPGAHRRELRRWAGGIPGGVHSGVAGRLLPG